MPGVQILTLTQGLLAYPVEVEALQSEPFTVMGITLMAAGPVPPVTVRMAEPETLPDAAVIIVVDVVAVEIEAVRAVAKPAAPIVATFGSDEFQVTDVVISVWLLSV